MNNKAISFAKKNNITLFYKNSTFPKYFASHKLDQDFQFSQKYLKSSDQIGSSQYTSLLDNYLGTTNNVFFALGKGYLESKNSFGLLYDPFVIINTPNVFMVNNDLLYELNNTQILQQFCLKNREIITTILPTEYKNSFWRAVKQKESLIIADSVDSAANYFENVLEQLPENITNQLKHTLQAQVVRKKVIKTMLKENIIHAFLKHNKMLNTFSDMNSKEVTIELQVPKQYLLLKGLIGIYVAY